MVERKQKMIVALFSLLLVVALLVTGIGYFVGPSIFKPSRLTQTDHGLGKDRTWSLTSLYASEKDWHGDFERYKRDLTKFESYKGHMGESAERLKGALDAKGDLDQLYDRLYAYALLRRDGNFTDEAAKTMWVSISSLTTEKGERTSFFYSELYKIPKNKVRTLANHPLLGAYQQRLINIAEDDYEPDERADYIRAISGNMLSMPEKFYQAYMYEYGEGHSENDQLIPLSRTDGNRDIRKKAFDRANEKLEKGMPLLSTAMAAKVEANKFQAKSEGYQDVVESFINDDGIDLSMYTLLMAQAEKDTDLLKQYMSYRKKALKISGPLKYYDADLKTTEDYGDLPYDQAVELNRSVVKLFGKSYADVFNQEMNDRWVDVYPRENKYSGSYTYSAYTAHPFILLNYENNLESAATLAHESGHAIHQYLNNRARAYEDADIPMIHAEIASTVNEVLFYDQLLKSAKTDGERATIMEAMLENFNSGFFYQGALAKFQDKIHRDAEGGQALETTYFNRTFGQILKQAYGPDYEISPYDEEGWAQVDHLYWDFYVYKYVMCMAVAVDIADRLEAGDPELLKAYERFLEVGSTRSVSSNLMDLGIDLSQPDYMDAFRNKYSKTLQGLMALNKK